MKQSTATSVVSTYAALRCLPVACEQMLASTSECERVQATRNAAQHKRKRRRSTRTLHITGSAVTLQCCKAYAKINRKIKISTPYKL